MNLNYNIPQRLRQQLTNELNIAITSCNCRMSQLQEESTAIEVQRNKLIGMLDELTNAPQLPLEDAQDPNKPQLQ